MIYCNHETQAPQPHGRKSRGYRSDSSPAQNLEWGTVMQIVPPPDFVTFQNFQDRTACITLTVQANVMPTEAVMAIGDKLRIIHFS